MTQYTYKMRLFPTKEQETKLAKHFGCIRFVYNHFLDNRVKFYLSAKERQLAKKSLNYYDDAAELTKLKKQPETEWLSEVNSQSLQHALKHLDGAFNRFYRKQAKFPRFKKKNRKNSFRIPQFVRLENNKIYFPKFKEGIKIDNHRPVEGEVEFATITMNAAGQYHACITVEKFIEKLEPTNKTVGIDLGVKELAVCSDGTRFPNIKPFRSLEQRIRVKQKELARSKKDSKGRQKARLKLAKLYNKISNVRNDHLHKASHQIVSENQTIILEDLNVKGMMANRKLSKSIWDVSLSELVRQISYKAEWYGRRVLFIDRWFPSSKTCHHCGYVNESLTLKDREWTCPRCKRKLDRDYNAAQNILIQGLNIKNMSVGTTESAECLGVSSVAKAIDNRLARKPNRL